MTGNRRNVTNSENIEIEKNHFSPSSAAIFGVKRSRYGKFDITMIENIDFELSENQNRFRFALLLPKIYAFEKWYYFPKFGTFGP